MKRKTGWYAALAAGMVTLLAGCSDQECLESGMAQHGKVVLEGSAETKKVSRSALSDTGVFSWLKGDQIDVYASDGKFYAFSLVDGAGTNQGEFSASLPVGTKVSDYGVSPAGLSPVLGADGQLSLTLPSAYTWAGQQTHAPMLAELDGNSLHFKNLGGLMKLSVGNIKEGCRIEVSSADHQLAGTMTVTEDAEGNAILKSVESKTGNQITFTSTKATEKQAFYMPLPVTDGNVKLNVKVYDAAENGVMKLEKNATLTIHRKELLLMPTLTIPETENAVVKDAASTEDLNSALENAVTEGSGTEGQPSEVIVTVNSNVNREEASATVEVSAPITIPTALTAPDQGSSGEGEGGGEGEDTPGEGEGEEETAAPTVKIIFDEVPTATAATDNKIVLTDNQTVTEDESKESQSQVEVAIPEAPEGVEPPSFDISLPTTTVTLTATQETATFKDVTATTADNTLIVAKGVTVINLFIVSGNVEVTGHIENITNLSGKTVYIRVSGSGSVGNVVGDVSVIREGDDLNEPFANESVADGQNIPYEISTWEQLRSLANRVEAARVNRENRPYADCYYVLTNDIDLGDKYWKPIGTENHSFAGIFDGDGHVITGTMLMAECDNAGFFGRIHNGGTVKNLTVAADIQILSEENTTSNYVGGISGNVNGAIFENCHYTGNIRIHTSYIGGIVGTATHATLKLCSQTGDLTNLNINGTVGGFIGVDNGSKLTGCYNTGDLTLDISSGRAGGIVGESYSETTITGCWASGTYTAKEKGGLFGRGNNYHFNCCFYAQTIGGVGGNGSWYGDETIDRFSGSTPTEEQIAKMNAQISGLGWKYNNDGTLSPLEGNTLPSNPVQPW